MSQAIAQKIASTAIDLRRSHPAAPAQDVLDLAFQGQQCDGLQFDQDATQPGAPLGQLIAEAFDFAMTPAEWRTWTGPQADPLLRDGLLKVWTTYVLPRFKMRYGLA